MGNIKDTKTGGKYLSLSLSLSLTDGLLSFVSADYASDDISSEMLVNQSSTAQHSHSTATARHTR